ncbi:hypothetical protein GCM10017687_71350 [Streptomyces echinatus]
MTGDLADDQAEQDVVGAGVGVAARAARREGESEAHRLKRGQGHDAPGGFGEVGQPAGVGEQSTQGDAPPVGAAPAEQPRQVPLHAVGQGEPVLGGQLEHDRRDEGLGDAAGAEVVGAGDALAGGRVAEAVPVPVGVLGQQGRGGGPAVAGQQRQDGFRGRCRRGVLGGGRGEQQRQGHRYGQECPKRRHIGSSPLAAHHPGKRNASFKGVPGAGRAGPGLGHPGRRALVG